MDNSEPKLCDYDQQYGNKHWNNSVKYSTAYHVNMKDIFCICFSQLFKLLFQLCNNSLCCVLMLKDGHKCNGNRQEGTAHWSTQDWKIIL